MPEKAGDIFMAENRQAVRAFILYHMLYRGRTEVILSSAITFGYFV